VPGVFLRWWSGGRDDNAHNAWRQMGEIERVRCQERRGMIFRMYEEDLVEAGFDLEDKEYIPFNIERFD